MFVVGLIGRKPTLFFVAILCVGQFVWTCHVERAALGAAGILIALAAVGLMLWGFEGLRIWGGHIVGEQQKKNADRQPARDGDAAPVDVAAK